MKALGLIILGVCITCASGFQLLMARASQSSSAALWFVATVTGLVVAFIGLIANHRSHTRR